MQNDNQDTPPASEETITITKREYENISRARHALTVVKNMCSESREKNILIDCDGLYFLIDMVQEFLPD
jgi:hypothetical protein